jgi:hypothetical protein
MPSLILFFCGFKFTELQKVGRCEHLFENDAKSTGNRFSSVMGTLQAICRIHSDYYYLTLEYS